MAKIIIGLLVGLGGGFAVAWYSADSNSIPVTVKRDAASEATAVADVNYAELLARIEVLEQALIDAESAERPRLEERVETTTFGSNDSDADDSAESAGAPSRNARDRRRQRLLANGLTPDEIDRVQAFETRRQLQNLETNWEQRRQRYLDGELDQNRTGQYFDELRAELGDVAFERYLDAAGFNRQLGISSIIPGTAADYAGLRAGDVIQRYNGERVYTNRDLTTASVAGERGESVSVEVLRDGQLVTLTLPRGPIGVQTGRARRTPLR